jgi:hypothetical protein
MPGPIPAPRPPALQAPGGRGERVVAAFTATRPDARRLARAAWESDPDRVAAHDGFDHAPAALRDGTIDAALRALQYLADHPDA